MPAHGCNEPSIRWSCLTTRERARIVRERVLGDLDDPDLRATAAAVRAFLHSRHGYTLVVSRRDPPCEVEFGIEAIGPAGYGRATTLSDAICIAALRAAGATVVVDD